MTYLLSVGRLLAYRKGRQLGTLVLGVAGLIPLAWFPVFLFIMETDPRQLHWASQEHRSFPLALLVHFLVTILNLLLLVGYEFDASRRIPQTQRTRWMVLLLIFSFFIYPIYLWCWIRPSNAAMPRELNANA